MIETILRKNLKYLFFQRNNIRFRLLTAKKNRVMRKVDKVFLTLLVVQILCLPFYLIFRVLFENSCLTKKKFENLTRGQT